MTSLRLIEVEPGDMLVIRGLRVPRPRWWQLWKLVPYYILRRRTYEEKALVVSIEQNFGTVIKEEEISNG